MGEVYLCSFFTEAQQEVNFTTAAVTSNIDFLRAQGCGFMD